MTDQAPDPQLITAGIAFLTNADRLAAMTAPEIRAYAVEILNEGAGADCTDQLIAHERDAVTASAGEARDRLAAAGHVDPQWLPNYRP